MAEQEAPPLQPQDAKRIPVVWVLAVSPMLFLLATLGTVTVAHLLGFAVRPLWARSYLVLAAGAFLTLLAGGIAHRWKARKGVVCEAALVFWLVLVALGFANLMFSFTRLHGYGDSKNFIDYLNGGHIYTKWFLGDIVLQFVHRIIWALPPIVRAILTCFETFTKTVQTMALFSMGIGTVCLFKKWPNRLSLVFCMFTPVWVAFSVGYVEYYPFVAWVIPLVYLWLLTKPLGERSPYAVGCVAAALPLTYVGFAPLCPVILLFYAVLRPKQALLAIGAALACAITLIAIFYKHYPHQFIEQYCMDMLPQELPDSYLDKTATKSSILFTSTYAVSPGHLRDVLCMLFFGGGLTSLAVLVGGSLFAVCRGKINERTLKQPELWLCVALFLVAVFYMLHTIPRLGPRHDVDMFFQHYITLAFLAGHLMDRLLARSERQATVQLAMVAVLLGNSMITVAYYLLVGMPESF